MGMNNRYMSLKEISRYCNELQKHKVKCECGHKVIIIFNEDSKICNWCGRRVYKNEKAEFKAKLTKLLKK